MKKISPSVILLALLGAALAVPARADTEPKYDHYLRSTSKTVNWGVYSAEYAPAITIKSGDILKIDTVNSMGVNRANPRKFFTDNNIPMDLPVVQQIIDVCENTPLHPLGLRGALLTGPVYVEGAEPGDTLEVRVHDVRFRINYGVNSTSPGAGHPLADLVPRPWTHKFDLDLERGVALFKPGAIELPLAPFFGQMGTAPPPSSGAMGAGPPTPLFGGNFDLQELSRGGTVFLPVNVPGAKFFCGNGHALQGNGEITNPSLEVNLTGYLQFIVHKGKPLKMSRVETPTHYIFLGMHNSLDDGMQQATKQVVEFLQEKEGLDFYDAYAVASLTTDFTVARALVPAQMVYASVPKSIFKSNPDYWYHGPVPPKF